MTKRGGLGYGMKLEGVPDQEAVVRSFCENVVWLGISEANIVSMPDLVPTIRRINPTCKIGLEVSAWGGWITPSQYWPLRSAFGIEAKARNWWMKYADGNQVTVGQPLLGLVDLTIPAARAWYIEAIKSKMAATGADFIFFDEWHNTLGFLKNAANLRLASAEATDVGWAHAMGRLVRGCGIEACVNGLGLTGMSMTFARRRYIQNAAGASMAGAVRQAREHLQYYGGDSLTFEHPAEDIETQIKLSGLVATFGGCAQMNPSKNFSQPIPAFPVPEDAS